MSLQEKPLREGAFVGYMPVLTAYGKVGYQLGFCGAGGYWALTLGRSFTFAQFGFCFGIVE